jgi:hypothetical protein
MPAEMFLERPGVKHLVVVDTCSRSHQHSTRSPDEVDCIFPSKKHLRPVPTDEGTQIYVNFIERSIK